MCAGACACVCVCLCMGKMHTDAKHMVHMVFVCADTGGHVCTTSGSRKMGHLIGSLDNESDIIPPESPLWLPLTYL